MDWIKWNEEGMEWNTIMKDNKEGANKDYWQIEEIVIETQNQDELKACLIFFSEQGVYAGIQSSYISSTPFNCFPYFRKYGNAQTHLSFMKSWIEPVWIFGTTIPLRGWDRANSGNYNSKGKDYDANSLPPSETGGVGTTDGKHVERMETKRAKLPSSIPYCNDRGIDTPLSKERWVQRRSFTYYLIQGNCL